LLQAEIAQLRVPVSSLCIAAAVPATTALRWLKTMTDKGIFLRRADPHDGRRVFVELSPSASEGMRRYFAEVGRAAVI
jgi:DNA-binding MarR family transcriptional regulator